MRRALVFVLALVVAALLGATDGSAVQSQNVKLVGTVGPGFSITLEDAQGNRVRNLEPGTYDVEVKDLSEEHNFHLVGPGVDEEITEVAFEGERTVTVQLEPGEYTFQCDPHASSMRGTFTVS